MTSRRAEGYGRLIAALERLGPAKLHSDEDHLIRETADTLLFIEDPDDPEARVAFERAAELIDRMVAVGRLQSTPAEELVEHLAAAGPPGLGAPALRN